MPGAPHEVLSLALRDSPDLLGELLRRTAGASVEGPIAVVDSTVRFAKSIEVRPDLVFRGKHPRWVIFELQNGIDPRKAQSWALAASLLFLQEKAMGEIVVLTASRRVAAWAKRVAHQRGPMGTRFDLTPIVIYLSREQVDRLLDPARPELALFAAWAMYDRRGPAARQVVTEAFRLTGKLRSPLREAQERAILGVLSEQMRNFLEAVAANPELIPETPQTRRLRLIWERFRNEGRAAGMAEGMAKGVAKGMAQGMTQGVAQGKQEALLALLTARGMKPAARQQKQILACTDGAVLDAWIVAAASAGAVSEVLAVTPAKPRAAKRRAARKPAA